MKTLKFNTNEEWMAARSCRITGSRLKDIVVKRGAGKKIGFYQLIAERIGIPSDGESPMDRGHRLELDAIERFEALTGKVVDASLVIWTHDDNENIAVSPDGFIGEKGIEAVEVKCLASARHIEALLTEEVPDEYRMQVVQYFIVNPDLETLHLCFYDPRLMVKDFFVIEVSRAQVQEEVDALLAYETETLKEVEKIVESLLSL